MVEILPQGLDRFAGFGGPRGREVVMVGARCDFVAGDWVYVAPEGPPRGSVVGADGRVRAFRSPAFPVHVAAPGGAVVDVTRPGKVVAVRAEGGAVMVAVSWWSTVVWVSAGSCELADGPG